MNTIPAQGAPNSKCPTCCGTGKEFIDCDGSVGYRQCPACNPPKTYPLIPITTMTTPPAPTNEVLDELERAFYDEDRSLTAGSNLESLLYEHSESLLAAARAHLADRCPECHGELSCCGEMTSDGPTLDCEKCILHSTLQDSREHATALRTQLSESMKRVQELELVVHLYLMDHAVSPRLKNPVQNPCCICFDCIRARTALNAGGKE